MHTVLNHLGSGPLQAIGEVFRYRHLLYMLAWRDISIKYKQSVLGLVWAILMPAMIVLAGVVVKLAFAMASGKQLMTSEIASVALKAVPWAFFVSSLRFGTGCLFGNTNLVTKIYFPKLILPLSAVLSQLFDFLIASCVLVVLLALLGVGWTANILWVPLLIFLLVMMSAGLSILLSAAGLFFRDVKYLVEMLLTFAIFFTPVFYEVSMFGKWGTYLLINPVAPLFEGLTSAVIEQQSPSLAWLGYSALFAAVLLGGSIAFFKRLEPSFAECI